MKKWIRAFRKVRYFIFLAYKNKEFFFSLLLRDTVCNHSYSGSSSTRKEPAAHQEPDLSSPS